MTKTFCIGFNKTGTTSLAEALQFLGFRTLHDVDRCREIVDAAQGGKQHPLAEDFDVFLDFPEPEYFESLDKTYPGSKFIFTDRNVEDWITSRLNHVLTNRRTGRAKHRKFEWKEIDTQRDRGRFQVYRQQVTAYFANRDDLLTLNICGGDGWRPLCEFLELDVPNTDFPHLMRGDHGYEFSMDWVTTHERNWLRIFAELIERPSVRMLEVGSAEGRSSVWWLQNILTHQSSHLTCVDTWSNLERERRFDWNIAITRMSHKVKKVKSDSRKVLGRLPEQSFDAVYVDGSHEGADTLLDGLQALPLLKMGGILLFDDYKWRDPAGNRRHLPQAGIDAFLEFCDWRVEVIYRGYQLAVRRKG